MYLFVEAMSSHVFKPYVTVPPVCLSFFVEYYHWSGPLLKFFSLVNLTGCQSGSVLRTETDEQPTSPIEGKKEKREREKEGKNML